MVSFMCSCTYLDVPEYFSPDRNADTGSFQVGEDCRKMFASICRFFVWSLFFVTVSTSYGAVLSSRTPRLNITVGIYGINTPYILTALPYVLPGFLAGLHHIGTRYDFEINTTVLSGRHTKMVRDCNDLAEFLYLVPQFYYSRPKDGSLFLLLHTGCNEIYELSAMSLDWNTLIFSSAGTISTSPNASQNLYHNEISSSLVDYAQMIIVLQALLKYYGWSTVAIVRDNDPLYNSLADTMTAFNDNSNDKLSIRIYDLLNVSGLEDGKLLSDMKNHARIVVLLMNAATVRTFLVYIFIEPYYNERRYGKLAWRQNKTGDLEAKEAFRSLLFVTSTCHSRQIGNRSLIARFKNESVHNYGGVYWESEEPTNAYFMYELVKLGGQVLDGALKAGMNIYDGFTIADLFRERTFMVDGRVVKTDKFNKVLFDYCVKEFNFDDDTWAANVLRYDAKESKYIPVNGTTVDWNNPENRPPPNEPYCGFTRARSICHEYNPLSFAASAWHWSLAILCLIVVVSAGWLYYRHRVLRNTEGPWWLITIIYSDVYELKIRRSSRVRYSMSYRR